MNNCPPAPPYAVAMSKGEPQATPCRYTAPEGDVLYATCPRGISSSDVEFMLLCLSADVNDAEDNTTLVDCPDVRIPDVITIPTTTRTTLPPTAPPGNTGAMGATVICSSAKIWFHVPYLLPVIWNFKTKTGFITLCKMSDRPKPRALEQGHINTLRTICISLFSFWTLRSLNILIWTPKCHLSVNTYVKFLNTINIW